MEQPNQLQLLLMEQDLNQLFYMLGYIITLGHLGMTAENRETLNGFRQDLERQVRAFLFDGVIPAAQDLYETGLVLEGFYQRVAVHQLQTMRNRLNAILENEDHPNRGVVFVVREDVEEYIRTADHELRVPSLRVLRGLDNQIVQFENEGQNIPPALPPPVA